MGRHVAISETPRPIRSDRRANVRPRSRSPFTLIAFGFLAACSFLAVNVVDPYSGATALPYFQLGPRYGGEPTQDFTATGNYETTFSRDGYEFIAAPEPEPEPEPIIEEESSEDGADGGYSAPPVAVADPGSAQAVAADMVAARGWGTGEFDCLVALWNKESGWRVDAMNPSSGAYGIPQALPGNKMSTAGADWQTNPATQIAWGLGYIENRYGTPCGAWGHSQSVGWY